MDLQTVHWVNDAVTMVGSGLAALAILFPFLKKAGAFVQKNAPEIEKGVEDALQLEKELSQSPLLSKYVTEGRLEAQHVLDELRKSKVAAVVGKVASGFAQQFGTFDSMPDAVKTDLANVVKDEAQKVGLNVTDEEVTTAVHDVTVASQTVANALKVPNETTNADLQGTASPAQPPTPPTTPSQA